MNVLITFMMIVMMIGVSSCTLYVKIASPQQDAVVDTTKKSDPV